MSDPMRDELAALFQGASPEIQKQLNQLLDIYQEKQRKLHKIHSESTIHRRRGTIHFGLIGYLLGLVIDEQMSKKSENSASFEQLLQAVKVGFGDLKKKTAAVKQIDPEVVVFEQMHYENILQLIQFEVDQLSKEIDVHEANKQNSSVCNHLVDSGEQELKSFGFSYIRGLFGLKTESERLEAMRNQQQFSEEQAKIAAYEGRQSASS